MFVYIFDNPNAKFNFQVTVKFKSKINAEKKDTS